MLNAVASSVVAAVMPLIVTVSAATVAAVRLAAAESDAFLINNVPELSFTITLSLILMVVPITSMPLCTLKFLTVMFPCLPMTYVADIYFFLQFIADYNKISMIKYNMKYNEICEKLKQLGYDPSVLNYPYRVKTVKGKIKLVKDPSKGLKK